jgi:hypothetical protein
MMDDLQQAYSAYQQALYHLSDPKVSRLRCASSARFANNVTRSRSFGTALAYYMIATDHWNTPRKPSLR